jgi:hypothetical protein
MGSPGGGLRGPQARRAAPRRSAYERRWTALLLFALGLLAAPAGNAGVVDFEGPASGTDAADASFDGVSVSGGLVLDEATVSLLLGVPASGTWNTTAGGAQGVLNTLDPALSLDFALPVTSLSLSVLALPDALGDPVRLWLLAFEGDMLVASDASDPAAVGDSGFPEDELSVAGGSITRALVCAAAAGPDPACLDPGLPTTHWIDGLRFEPIPEPTALALLAGSLGLVAGWRRIR